MRVSSAQAREFEREIRKEGREPKKPRGELKRESETGKEGWR